LVSYLINYNSKILICGAGSVGLRHAKNLISLGYKDIFFFTKRKNILINNKKFKTFSNLKKLLKEHNFKLAFITNETHKHVDTAIKCALNGIHLFIEKPLSNKKNKINMLLKILKQKKLISMVGYMMRFHPAIKIIKRLIKKKKFGKIFHFYSEWGEYLPSWHPKENYKKSYASNISKGGGSTLTLSHDIDLMQYFFGKIKKNFLSKTQSGLEINSETGTNIMIEFKNGISGFIHLDYLQKLNERYLKITGTKLSIKFYYLKNLLIIIKNKKEKRIKFKNFKRNQLFLTEIKYFIQKCKKSSPTMLSVSEAFKNLDDLKLIR
tara:strand:+ start:1314 stop:2279 length:966 start_codon:yes stop_codon:yes gene_type:complete